MTRNIQSINEAGAKPVAADSPLAKPYGFGVDVGGTTVKIGLFDNSGSFVDFREIPTKTEAEGSAILPDIAQAISQLMEVHGLSPKDVKGIGIGVPGPVNEEGLVNRCVNLNWGVFNLHEALGKLTNLTVKAGNDANCAALGEHYYGGGQGASSTLFVTLGTGIGGGVIIGGKVLSGAHGVGGEVGHITVTAQEKLPCTCGKFGCVEQYASANGIVRLTKKWLAQSDEPSLLRSMDDFTCKDIFAAAKGGEAFAIAALEQVFDYLGEALASACCVIDPERIVLGGGVSKTGDYLLQGVERHFRSYMFHACKDTQFSLATLGNDAGMYGAYCLLQA